MLFSEQLGTTSQILDGMVEGHYSRILAGHIGEDFLAVTKHGLIEEMRPVFAESVPLGTIRSNAGAVRERPYALYILRGYRGPPTPVQKRR